MSSTVLSMVLKSTIKGSGDRLLLMVLADEANDMGFCIASTKLLKRRSGLGKTALYDRIASLEKQRLIHRECRWADEAKKVRDVNSWRINVPLLQKMEHPEEKLNKDEEAELARLFGDISDAVEAQERSSDGGPESGPGVVRNPDQGSSESGKPQLTGVVRIPDQGSSESGKPTSSESPIPSSFPSLPQNEGGREGGEISSGTKNDEAASAEPTDAALEVISDGLDWKTWGIPNLAHGRALAVLIDEAVATGLTLNEVRAHCQVVINRATQSAIGLLKIELTLDKLPMPRRKTPAAAPQKATEITTTPSAPRLTEEQEKTVQEAREAACEELGRPFDRWGPADQARMRSISQSMARECAAVGDIADALVAEITGAPSYSKPVAEPEEDAPVIAPDLEAVRAQALLDLTRAYGLDGIDSNPEPSASDAKDPVAA